MKKVLTYAFTVLLVIALGFSGLSYFFFDIAQIEVHTASKDNVASHINTEVIKIPLASYEAQKDKDEIWYEGALYDVGSYEIVGDVVLVTVLHDRNEESLIGQAVENIESGFTISTDHTANHFSKHKTHHTDDLKIIPEKISINAAYFNNVTPLFYHTSIAIYPDNAYSIIKPPPQFPIC